MNQKKSTLFDMLTMDAGPERDKLADKLGYKIGATKPQTQAKIDKPQSKRIKGDSTNSHKSELEIEKEIRYYLLKNHIEHWSMKVKGEIQSIGRGRAVLKASQNPGFPDILCCINGKFVTIEVKKPGGIQSHHQINMQERIQKANGVYMIVTSVTELDLQLRGLVLCEKLK